MSHGAVARGGRRAGSWGSTSGSGGSASRSPSATDSRRDRSRPISRARRWRPRTTPPRWRVVAEQGIAELVVGLPLEAPARRARWPRRPARGRDAVADCLGLPVTLRDERLSSHLAESRLGPMPRGRSGGPPSRTQRDRYREAWIERPRRSSSRTSSTPGSSGGVTGDGSKRPRAARAGDALVARVRRAGQPAGLSAADATATAPAAGSGVAGILRFLLFAGVLAGSS